MEAVNIHEAKTRLSELLKRVEQGEELIIARAGEPVARLVPYRSHSGPRRLGQFRGQAVLAEGFDEVPEDIRAAFSEDTGTP